MSLGLRSALYKKIQRSFKKDQIPDSVLAALSHFELRLETATGNFFFSLPIKTRHYDVRDYAIKIAESRHDSLFKGVSLTSEKHSGTLLFHLNKNQCVKEIIESEARNVAIAGPDSGTERIIVEYSSPNIAKPFHLGHLRSTIIGNCIANLNDIVGNKVTRINYLGDWGTQFGFVQLGVHQLGITDEEMKKEPIKLLYQAYVHANKLAEEDAAFSDKARKIFSDLESGGSPEHLRKWENFRRLTIDELAQTYQRLGVSFDEYNWESSYDVKKVSQIIRLMESQGILSIDKEGRKVVALSETKNIPIIKSDGSTLYIARDIAAALDRYERHEFDRMYYVVDNAQTDHFVALFKILNKMGVPWAEKLEHVKFGRIKGMSTRKGSAVFLKDILDETGAVMRENQIRSPNTKVVLDSSERSTDVLGVSAVIINDLKQRRTRDYEFDWEKALDVKGDTGVKLQYVHCRLTSLEENSGAKLANECDPAVINEPIIDQLVLEIGRFDQAVIKSHRDLEPCVLVNYLFGLSNVVNRGLKMVRVKGEPEDVASQRLLVFNRAKKVLGQGMRLLGVEPLDKM